MALTTYTELKASVADWLNRTDLTSVVPDFIALAEAQIERTLRTRQMIVRATASIDTEYSAVPADFLETKSIKLNTNPVTALTFESIDALDSLKSTTPVFRHCGRSDPRVAGAGQHLHRRADLLRETDKVVRVGCIELAAIAGA
jgi:hypothetical protein